MFAFGRARWGVSGSLYSRPALARLNSRFEGQVVFIGVAHVSLKVGTYAIEDRELRQVRKGAAVSDSTMCSRPLAGGNASLSVWMV